MCESHLQQAIRIRRESGIITHLESISRRRFLKLSAASGLGLLVGFPHPGEARPAARMTSLNPLIRIGSDGSITLFAQNPEMGQGVKTSLPMILAEELDVDWAQVTIEQADWNPALERQFSGGSLSVRLNWDALRQAGASAREMLVSAAAARWNVQPEGLTTEGGFVIDDQRDRRLAYGELAEDAALLPVPAEPRLKSPADYQTIGRSISDVDLAGIVTGQQTYSLDVKLPRMLYAVIARCPDGDGQPVSFDDSKARSIAGVVDVRPLRNDEFGGRIILPNCPNFVSGVAVIAETTWAAMQGARVLQVEWSAGASDNSASLMKALHTALDNGGEVIRDDGDVDNALQSAGVTVDATYRLPFLAHVCMEPMNLTASVSGEGAEFWAPTQNPQMLAEAAGKALGIDVSQIKIHVLRSGGAFGRRFYADYAIDAAILSRGVGRPVKVVWTREDDVRYDYFRPASAQRVRAGVDESGRISCWQHKVASHPRETYLERDGSPAEISNYEFPAAFVPNLRYAYSAINARIPVGQWRAVEHSSNIFVVSSVIDELAQACGTDPVRFWLNLVGTKEIVQVREDFPFNASRLRRVIEVAASASGWRELMPANHGRGIAASYNQGSWVAEVAEVSIVGNVLKIERVTAAIDCGLVINPKAAVRQVEGGIIEGISAVLFGEITVKDGIVEQSNFHDYALCRMQHVPAIDVHFVASTEAPRGLGEPPLPPVAPAITNAIFAASGRRIRELPLKHHFTV